MSIPDPEELLTTAEELLAPLPKVTGVFSLPRQLYDMSKPPVSSTLTIRATGEASVG